MRFYPGTIHQPCPLTRLVSLQQPAWHMPTCAPSRLGVCLKCPGCSTGCSLLLCVCFCFNAGLQTSLVLKDGSKLPHIMGRFSIKLFHLLFPLILMLMNLGFENLYFTSTGGFPDFQISLHFFFPSPRRSHIKCTQ